MTAAREGGAEVSAWDCCRPSSASGSSRSAKSGKGAGRARSELFVDTLVAATGGHLPENFVVTLPKVTIPEQPRTLVRL